LQFINSAENVNLFKDFIINLSFDRSFLQVNQIATQPEKQPIHKFFSQTVHSQRGMSLIEILVALTILVMSGTFVTTKVFERLHEGRVSSATIQMQNLKGVLREFKRKCGRYPTTEQGLEALIDSGSAGECKRYPPNGFLEEAEVPADPWENPYYYESDGRSFNIISFGNDGEEGGEGEDADVSLNKATNS